MIKFTAEPVEHHAPTSLTKSTVAIPRLPDLVSLIGPARAAPPRGNEFREAPPHARPACGWPMFPLVLENRARRFRFTASLLALATLTAPALVQAQAAPAEPPSKQACFEGHARSQELRLDGSLIEARAKLRVCSDLSCPAMLRTDCADWLAQIEQAIPTVVFLAERDNDDVVDVRVSADGKPLTQKLDGEAFEFNPGAHRFKFELAGFPAIEQTVVLRQMEKRRAIRVEFRTPQPAVQTPPAPPNSAAPAPGAGSAPANGPRPIPALTYVFGGIALVAAGAGAYLGLDAMATHREREESCAPNCPAGVVDDLKTQLLLADILGGAAIASGTLSAIFFFARPVVRDERPASGSNFLRQAATPPRVNVSVTGTF